MKCHHPCGCEEDPCPRHGPRCTNTPLPLGLCSEHGCSRCGGTILADTEDWKRPACFDCFHELGEPAIDPDVAPSLKDDQAYMYPKVPDPYTTRMEWLDEDGNVVMVSEPVDIKFELAIPYCMLIHIEPVDEPPEPYNGPWPPVEQF